MSKNVFDIGQEPMSNAYPGRGIILGRTPDNKKNVIAYFIMGRSENSRNRVFTETEDGIRTEAFDPSKMVDPSLIIYHPVRLYDGTLVVTNGDQTDTIVDFLKQGKSYFEALRTRQFEPDAPNYTSRISGVVNPDGSYSLSILKNFTSDRTANKRFFYEYDKPVAGLGPYLPVRRRSAAAVPRRAEVHPHRAADQGIHQPALEQPQRAEQGLALRPLRRPRDRRI